MAETKIANLGLLLRCYEGLRNWRALVMLVVGFVVDALLMSLSVVITFKMGYGHQGLAEFLSMLLMLVGALVVLTGINGAGLLLVDQADGGPLRSFGAAFFGGIGVTLQMIVCLLILGIGLLLVVVVLWALSFLGHIPGIGGLFAFLFAGLTMLILAFCYAVLVFGVALMYVAIWRGHGIVGSIGRAIDIVVKRPLDTVLHFIVLTLLIVPVGLFVALVVTGGSIATELMYMSGNFGDYMDGGYSGMNLLGAMAPHFSAGGMSGASVSLGIVVAAIYALFVLIYMLGTVLIFDSLAAETDATSADFLRRQARDVRAKVDEHRPQAGGVARPPASPDAQCAHCGAALTPGDRFCGVCGTPTS